MTIEKDRPWGAPGSLPAGAPVAHSDAEAARIVTRARLDGEDMPTVGLLAGDLCRTVGGPGNAERLHGPEAMTLPMDLVSIIADGVEHHFVAHLLVRGPWVRGTLIAAMNAQWVGAADVAPKSHPNDGILDIFDASALSFDDRLKARRRLATGTHVPHRDIVQRRVESIELDLPGPTRAWVDSAPIGRVRSLRVTVIPDAWKAVI